MTKPNRPNPNSIVRHLTLDDFIQILFDLHHWDFDSTYDIRFEIDHCDLPWYLASQSWERKFVLKWHADSPELMRDPDTPDPKVRDAIQRLIDRINAFFGGKDGAA